MSSFTDHTAISPSATKPWMRDNDASYSYWTDLFWKRITITVPKWYCFDWTSVPSVWLRWIWSAFIHIWWTMTAMFFFLASALIQKVQTDTIAASGVHDRWYTHERRIWRIRLDIIYLEALIVYNIPKLFEEKRYWFAFLKILQYIAMTVVLLLFSWIVRYDVRWKMKKIFKFFLSC